MANLFMWILIILLGAAIWAVICYSEKKSKRKENAKSSEAKKEDQKKEPPPRTDLIREAIELLHKNFGVPYPYLHFLDGESEDCLYFKLEDSLPPAKKGAYDPLHDSLLLMMNAVFKHVNLPLGNVTLEIIKDKKDPDKPGERGTYRPEGFNCGHITVKYSPRMGPDEFIAVTAHECMHHVLRQSKVSYPETEKNELLTDIAVLFFGIGGSLKLAYEEKQIGVSYETTQKRDRVETRTITRKQKIGYLTSAEIYEADKMCTTLRERWIRQRTSALTEKKNELDKRVSLNRALFQASLKMPTNGALSDEEYALLSENAMEIQEDPEMSKHQLELSCFTLESDYRTIYKCLAKEFDARIKKYDQYNLTLNKLLGYIG